MQTSEIKLIRTYYIKKYGTCDSKKAGLFARPDYPHFKSGKIVRKILEIDNGINILDPEALDYVKQEMTDSPRHEEYKECVKRCLLADYCLKNKLKSDTQRGYIMARNLSILFLSLYGQTKAKELMKQFERIQKTTGSEWIDWAIKNKRNEFACGELRNWLREKQSVDVEELCCWRCEYGKSK